MTDGSTLEMILKALKFENFINVDKKRQTFNHNDELEIALDEVKKLGYYIEIETIKDLESVEKAREEILKFTKILGLKRTKTVPGGYAAELL